jgi:transposase, IS5 family
MKVDKLMGRNRLKGTAGDAIHAILCAAGQNLRLLLHAIAAFLRLNAQTLLCLASIALLVLDESAAWAKP